MFRRHDAAAMQGLATIRAYGAQQHYQSAFQEHMELNGSWWYAYIATNRWIGCMLDVNSAIVLACSVVLTMAMYQVVSGRSPGIPW